MTRPSFLARTSLASALPLIALTLAPAPTRAQAPDTDASFFITSQGPGDGADLGGLEGADAHCARLAAAVGLDHRVWHAYLSTTDPVVHARDRIGTGPWYNVRGVMVARDVEHLHGENGLTKETVLTEAGEQVNGRDDDPNRHDILTGSGLDGRAQPGEADTTCSDWTSGGEGSALVGHHDRTGGGANPSSWNSAHGSRGCSQSDLQVTAGDGLFYCFAVDTADGSAADRVRIDPFDG